MVCAKCNLDFSSAKEAVKCAECGQEYHVACCRIKTVAKLNKMSAKVVAAWRCDACVQDTASGTSRSDNEDHTVLDFLTSIKQELAESRAANKDNFSTLQQSMASLHEALADVRGRLLAVEAENTDLRKDCADLKKVNRELSNQVANLHCEIADMQQYSRNHNLEVRGIPLTKNEDVYAVVDSVAKAISVTHSRQNISIAHRLPAPRGQRFNPSIVIQFLSRSTRALWLEAAKQKRIQTSDLFPSLAPAPVFINEHLTVFNKQLLGRARSYVKEGRLAFAWTKVGKIMVRKTATSATRRVWTVDDLDSVVKAAVETSPSPTVQGVAAPSHDPAP